MDRRRGRRRVGEEWDWIKTSMSKEDYREDISSIIDGWRE